MRQKEWWYDTWHICLSNNFDWFSCSVNTDEYIYKEQGDKSRKICKRNMAIHEWNCVCSTNRCNMSPYAFTISYPDSGSISLQMSSVLVFPLACFKIFFWRRNNFPFQNSIKYLWLIFAFQIWRNINCSEYYHCSRHFTHHQLWWKESFTCFHNQKKWIFCTRDVLWLNLLLQWFYFSRDPNILWMFYRYFSDVFILFGD